MSKFSYSRLCSYFKINSLNKSIRPYRHEGNIFFLVFGILLCHGLRTNQYDGRFVSFGIENFGSQLPPSSSLRNSPRSLPLSPLPCPFSSTSPSLFPSSHLPFPFSFPFPLFSFLTPPPLPFIREE